MKYIRTKDGRIVDLEKFINEEKDTPYYKNFRFNKISKDGRLKWTAVGTEKCSLKDQIGRRCHFSASLNSEVIKQANTIEELCDEFVLYHLPLEEMSNNETWKPYAQYERLGVWQTINKTLKSKFVLYGAIWTDKGLIFVAKTNEEGELCLFG